MISSELAKELKDAGWQQNKYEAALGDITHPTLEELIEACGDDLHSIARRSIRDVPYWVVYDIEGNAFLFPTLIEAVARLWLTLNKK